MNKNEPNPLKRRTRVFMYEDDNQTAAPAATDFSAAGVVKVDVGAGLVDAGGTFLNTGIAGDFIYTWTRAETNVDCNELAVVVQLAGFKVTAVTVELEDPQDFIAALKALSHRAGRTFLGFLRRADAYVSGPAANLKGGTPTFFQDDGATEEFHIPQDSAAGARGVPNIAESES